MWSLNIRVDVTWLITPTCLKDSEEIESSATTAKELKAEMMMMIITSKWSIRLSETVTWNLWQILENVRQFCVTSLFQCYNIMFFKAFLFLFFLNNLIKDPVRTKIVIDDIILKQVSNFNYSSCDIIYKRNHILLNRS